MPGFKQHLKRIEAKHHELKQFREGRRKFLLVTFMPEWTGTHELAAPQPGERTVEDFYIDRPIEWRPNYTMLNGTGVRRNTSDPEDHGVVYDERAAQHDWSEAPPQGLPILSRLKIGGKIDPLEVKRWPDVRISNKRVSLGEPKLTRAGSR